MFEKLDQIEVRYSEIAEKLAQPEVIAEASLYMELMKEYKKLTPIVEKYHAYQMAAKAEHEAEMLLAEPQDDEFRAMAEEERRKARGEKERLTQELTLLLLPHDANDERNVIVEIRAGAGGEEAALFAGDLFRMYSMYAESKGWKTELLGRSETELGGIKEVSFLVTGEGVYSRLKYERGVHRVQRVPETEAAGRIHTSTVTVAVMPEAEEVELHIDPDDLKIDTYRSSGAGGQHVNKTESAIRITHLPTGMVVECQDERSQYKNRDKAMKILRSRLYQRLQAEQNEKIAAERHSQVGTGDRSERIRTYNFPQGRVTDHRVGLTVHRIDAVLNGDLDELINALTKADRADQLLYGSSEEKEAP